jgi:general secretion pathway protein A
MYKEFYGFSEEPFALKPDPEFLFLTEYHKNVLDSLMQGITGRKGYLLVTGETGTGKTILLHQLMLMLDPKVKAVLLNQPSETFDELLKNILRDLDLPLGEQGKSFMLLQLHEYSLQKSSQEETLLILVDEAQELNEEVMEELRMLCSPDPRKPGPGSVQIVFVGDPEIEQKLKSQNLRQLLQRIAVTCRLRPLSEGESRQYIEHRLNRVGSSILDVFTPAAIDLICRYSEGNPLGINMLCYMAISGGCALSKKKVDAAVVETVFPILGRQKPSRWKEVKRPIEAFLDHVENSSLITKITYMLLAYSILALLFLFCLNLLF